MKRQAIAKIPEWIKQIVALCLAVLVGLAVLKALTPAPAYSQSDSRVSRLETEVFNLRSQLSRLESQVYRLSNRVEPRDSTDTSPEIPLPESPPPRPVKPTDPMFDRLANLVVDLKEQVRKIDARLSRLERR